MDNTLIFIDSGFLSKLSKYFGNGKYINYDIIKFAKNLAEKQNLNCKHIFYFIAPPFQSNPSTKEEDEKRRKYDKFIYKLLENKEITIYEGRCQRIKDQNSKFVFKQKQVDTLLSIELMKIPIKHSDVKKVILISSDTDFIPVINELKEFNIKVILYIYYEEKRNTNFSRNNDLIKSVYKYVLLSKQDFINCPLLKNK